ncbi:MAG TPA: alkaline phosphatase family protein [Candidatus Polarisedimenticolia bacterium]|nr:alkaline phosphatase family protein [Candidatus Polarisedimenticolia bacterium]
MIPQKPAESSRWMAAAALVVMALSAGCSGRGGTSSPGLPPLSERFKVIVFGVDGADWRVIRPLMDAGRMPHFRKMVDGGASGVLLSMEPTLSPALWTTIATGLPPASHGIADFIVRLPGGGYRPVTSDMRSAPAFWNILGNRDGGRTAGVVAWLATWPAEPIHGYMVTSYLPYVFNWSTGRPLKGTVVEGIPRQTFPDSLMREIEPLKVKPEALDRALVGRFYDASALPRVSPEARECVEGFLWSLASDETYRRIGLHLYARHSVDLFAVYFGGIDVVSHRFWKFTYPQDEPYATPPAEIEILKGVIPGYYEYIDEILGEFMSRMDQHSTLVVLSDHGFKPVFFPGKPTTSGHHRLEGILALYGRGIAPGATIEGATLVDVLPTVFALIGEPISRQLPGKILAGAFSELGAERRKAAYVDAYPPRPAPSPAAADQEVDSNVIERLKSLGYIQ